MKDSSPRHFIMSKQDCTAQRNQYTKEYKQRNKSAVGETEKCAGKKWNMDVYMKEYRKSRKCSIDEADKCALKCKKNTPMKEYGKKKKLDN